MKLIYIPINTSSLQAPEQDLEIFMRSVVEQVCREHLGRVRVLLYLSRRSAGISVALNYARNWLPWEIAVDPDFDQVRGDAMAAERAAAEETICIRVVPGGLLDKAQQAELSRRGADRFSETIVYELPESIQVPI